MENVIIEESETGSDNTRGDNEEESGQLGVDSGQVRKVGSTSGKENCI